MSAPDSTVFQFNFKTPSGSLHNIYATNGTEAVELLDAFAESLIEKVFDVEQKLIAAGNVAAVVAAPVTVTPAPAAPVPTAAPSSAPAGSAPLCEHGQPMKLVPAGISKASGKPYPSFYACAQARGQQCNAKASV